MSSSPWLRNGHYLPRTITWLPMSPVSNGTKPNLARRSGMFHGFSTETTGIFVYDAMGAMHEKRLALLFTYTLDRHPNHDFFFVNLS